MSNGQDFSTVTNMLKRKYPEVFYDDGSADSGFQAFANKLEEYHKYLSTAVNELPTLIFQAEQMSEDSHTARDGSQSWPEISNEVFETTKASVITRIEESLHLSGVRGLNEELAAVYLEAEAYYQDYSFSADHDGPVSQLLKLISIKTFVEADFLDIKASLEVLREKVKPEKREKVKPEKREKVKPEKRESIDIFDKTLGDEPDDVAEPKVSPGRQPEKIEEPEPEPEPDDLVPGAIITLDSLALESKEVLRKPSVKPLNTGSTVGIYASLNLEYKATYLSDKDPRSFFKLLEASGKDIFEFSSFFKGFGNRGLGFELDEETDEVEYKPEYISEMLSEIAVVLGNFSSKLAAAEATSTVNTKSNLHKFEKSRQSIADNIDRFIMSIKYRDKEIYMMLKDLDLLREFPIEYHPIYLVNNIKNQDSESFGLLKDLIYRLVFPDVLSQAYRHKPQFREYDDRTQDVLVGGWTDEMDDLFIASYATNIKLKIGAFFDIKNTDKNLCRYLSENISQEVIRQDVVNVVQGKSRYSWTYANCSMCGKGLYIKKMVQRFGGKYRREAGKSTDEGASASRKDRNEFLREYSDFKLPLYSLFRKDGSQISIDQLSVNSKTGEEYLHSPPKKFELSSSRGVPTAPRSAPMRNWGDLFYGKRFDTGPKTWSQIDDLINSGNKTKHAEGLLRRAEVLRKDKAKYLGRSDVIKKRFKCPFKDQTGIPPELVVGAPETEGQRKTQDFNCGYSVDLSASLSVLGQGDSIDPKALRSGTFNSSRSQVLTDDGKIERALSSAINNETFTADVAEEVRGLLNSRRSGGWKYSNTYFRCPTLIDIADKDDIESLYKKYGYIVSPLSGPTAEDSDLSAMSLPSDGAGGVAQLEPGTVVYMACGAATSLSSFNFPELKKLLVSADVEYKKDLTEALISYGVEATDLTYVLGSPEAIKESFFTGEDGRLTKFAKILSMAMASKNIKDDAANLIGDVVLTCRHGHSFTVNNSVNFGNTHCRFVPKLGAEVRQLGKLLRSSGRKNLEIAMKKNMISRVPENTILDRYDYNTWVKSKDHELGRLSFSVTDEGEVGKYYFSETQYKSKSFAWGGPQTDESIVSSSLKESSDTFRTRYERSGKEQGIETSSGEGHVRNAGDSRTYNKSLQVPDMPIDMAVLRKNKDICGETITELLNSSFKTCSNFLRLSSSLDVRGSLLGTKVFSLDKYEDKIYESIKELIQNLLNKLNQDGKLDDELATTDVMLEIFNKIKDDEKSFINKTMKTDTKFLSFLEDEFIDPLFRNIINYSYDILLKKLDPKIDIKKRWRIRNSLYDEGQIKSEFLSHFDDIRSEIFEAININEKDVKKLSKYVFGPGGTKSKIIARMSGQMYLSRIIYASISFYIADQLSIIFNKFIKDNNQYSYIGFEIDLNYESVDLSSPQKVIDLCSAHSNFNFFGYTADMDDDSLDDYIGNILGCIAGLNAIPHGMETAANSRLYKEPALEYIKQKLEGTLEEDEESDEKTKAKSILKNIFITTPETNINLNDQSKYSKYFKPRPLESGESIRTMMIPSFGANTCVPKDKKESFSEPVYALFNSKDDYRSFDLSFSNEEKALVPDGFICVLTRLDLSSIGIFVEAITASLPEGIRSNGFRAFALPEKDIKISSDNVSMMYHPYTEISNVAGEVSVRNTLTNFASDSGFNIGPQFRKKGKSLLFPPISDLSIDTFSNVGVPVPIENSPTTAKIAGEIIPMVGARIEVFSDNYKLELSDLLQRTPTKDAANILIKIIKIYNKFKEVSSGLSEQGAEDLRSNAKENIEILFKHYRGMPFNVVRRSNCRTKIERSPVKFKSLENDNEDEAEEGVVDASYVAASGYYVPFIDYVLMNKVLTLECFSEKWAGHQVFLGETPNVDLLNSAQQFIIKTHGLDYAARKLNEELKLSGSSEILAKDLLDPYKSLVLKRGNLDLPNLFSVDEFDKETGLRLSSGQNTDPMETKSKNLFPHLAGGHGEFFRPAPNDNAPEDNVSFLQVINTLFPIGENAEEIRSIQDPDSDTIMNALKIYRYASHALSSNPVTLRLHPELKASISSVAVGLNSVAAAIKIYYLDKMNQIITAKYKDRLEKKASFSQELLPENDESINRSEILKVSSNSGVIIIDEALWNLWRITTGI